MTDNEKISASQVKTWNKCPKQWWFRKRSDLSPTKADSKYANFGIAVHEAIENVLSKQKNVVTDQTTLRELFIAEFASIRGEHDVPDGMFEDAEKCLSTAARFVEKHSERKIKAIEKYIEFKMSQGEVTGPVSSIIDVVADGEIWDWKTGRIRDDTQIDEYIQSSVYALAYNYEYGDWPETVRFIYLKEERMRTVGGDNAPDAMNKMIRTAESLQTGKEEEEYPANPGEKCYWCRWEMFCDDSPVGVGQLDWGKWSSL